MNVLKLPYMHDNDKNAMCKNKLWYVCAHASVCVCVCVHVCDTVESHKLYIITSFGTVTTRLTCRHMHMAMVI